MLAQARWIKVNISDWLHAKSLQSCPTLCDPTGSFVHGILQTKILEWVAFILLQGIFPTQGSNLHFLCLLQRQEGFYITSGTWESPASTVERESESRQVVSDSLRLNGLLQSMEFSRPEYWSGQPFPSPADLPNPGIKPRSPALKASSLPAELQGKPSINRESC